MTNTAQQLNGHAITAPDGVEIKGLLTAETTEILSIPALQFLADMTRKFRARRNELLAERAAKWQALQEGGTLDFDPATKDIREGDWKVGSIPEDLQDRRVEITGPVDRKMVINALNSGARMFMADFEDASSPTWENMTEGQVNMRDAINRSIQFTNEKGKEYKLNDQTATLLVRPRGWHLDEKHLLVDGEPIPGGFMDFGLYFFHNIKAATDRGTGCYFYLPKTEHWQETALWNDVFNWSEEQLDIPHGSIKCTVLVETITASFQLHEILHSLKDYIVALNCGRWDYIFSYIKMFHKNPAFLLPDRAQVTMTTHFMRSYSQLVIKTCHARSAMAMGGMAAAIPVKNDEAANDRAFAAVKKDKEREAGDGHDGTWVAHPALVPVAMEAFDAVMKGKNQIEKLREDVNVSAADLLKVPESGEITEEGMRLNISVAIQYIAAWLTGRGAVPINNLMEDAATAEISRAQLWQCVHHGAELADGRKASLDLFNLLLKEEMEKLQDAIPAEAFEHGRYRRAASLLDELVSNEVFEEFLTLPGYELIS
jgi:malate synthase